MWFKHSFLWNRWQSKLAITLVLFYQSCMLQELWAKYLHCFSFLHWVKFVHSWQPHINNLLYCVIKYTAQMDSQHFYSFLVKSSQCNMHKLQAKIRLKIILSLWEIKYWNFLLLNHGTQHQPQAFREEKVLCTFINSYKLYHIGFHPTA